MKRFVTGIAAVALCVGGLAVYAASTVGADTTPAITVTPNTGLTNDQTVSVMGTNFDPTGSYAIVECIVPTGPPVASDCNGAADLGQPGGPELLTALSFSGTSFTANYTVATGSIGTETLGANSQAVIAVASVATTSLVTGLQPVGIAFGTDSLPTLTSTTTTTTAGGTTTTTAPPTTTVKTPKATKASGTAVPGKSSTITVSGSNLSGAKSATAAGASVTVASSSASKVTLKVKESAKAKKGKGTLTIHFKSGKSASVKFTIS
jgi:hypothetical protein